MKKGLFFLCFLKTDFLGRWPLFLAGVEQKPERMMCMYLCVPSLSITGMAEDHNHVLVFFSFDRFKDVLSSLLVRESLHFSDHLSYQFTFMPRAKYF